MNIRCRNLLPTIALSLCLLAGSAAAEFDYAGYQIDDLSKFAKPSKAPKEPVATATSVIAEYYFDGCSDEGWTTHDLTGVFGDFAALQASYFQEDVCQTKNCSWVFHSGSPDMFFCEGLITVPVIPHGPINGEYMRNEIWSPSIAWTGTGDNARLEFCVYKDLPLDNLVFYVWHVRTSTNGVIWSPWCDDGFVYMGEGKRWETVEYDVTSCIPVGTQFVQVALGVWDMCDVWCGSVGTGTCHTPAPMFDNVRLLRDDLGGPAWSVRSVQLFQDSFANDGTAGGTVAVDRAEDVLAGPGIVPGDEAVATVTAAPGLNNDLNITGTANRDAVYIHVKEIPGRTGALIQKAGYPYTGQNPGGWAILLADDASAPKYLFSLNDVIYRPGEVIEYYFSAVDIPGNRTYWSEHTGATTAEADVRDRPMEMTCLPGPGVAAGGDILYVDAADGTNSQLFWDVAFQSLAIDDKVDRYDLRAPTGHHGNGLGSRVQNVLAQLIPFYKVILWSTGTIENATIGDGTGTPIESDDFDTLFKFVDWHFDGGGLYIGGDNAACQWDAMTGASALALRNQKMNFQLVDCSHTNSGLPLSPLIIGEAASAYFHDFSAVAHGGCPFLCKFDVLLPQAPATLEIAYEGNSSKGALLAQSTLTTDPVQQHLSTVKLAGFALMKIRDDIPDSVPDRTQYLAHVLECLGTVLDLPVPVVDAPVRTENQLAQNYPNPFNPTTTIRFQMRDAGHATLRIFDAAGRLVATLVNGHVSAGEVREVTWEGRGDDGNRVSTGVYFYRLETPTFAQTRKMVLLK